MFSPRSPVSPPTSHQDSEETRVGYELCFNCLEGAGVVHSVEAGLGTAGSEQSVAGSSTTSLQIQQQDPTWRTAAPKKGHTRHSYIEKIWGEFGWEEISQDEATVSKCSACGTSTETQRYKCASCHPPYSLCKAHYRVVHLCHPHHPFILVPDKPKFAQIGIEGLSEAEGDGDDEHSMEHSATCAHCLMPIVGALFHCAICESVDICSNCEAAGLPGNLESEDGAHNSSHILLKLQKASRAAMKRWHGRDAAVALSASHHSQLEVDGQTVIGSKSTSNHMDSPLDHGVPCNNCHQRIIGTRYQCCHCPSYPSAYNLCAKCEARSWAVHDPMHIFFKLPKRVNHPLESRTPFFPTLYEVPAGPAPGRYPLSDDPREYLKDLVHRAVLCDNCMNKVEGEWFHCACCPIDLCDQCESVDTHDTGHAFVVFKSTIDIKVYRNWSDPENPTPILDYPTSALTTAPALQAAVNTWIQQPLCSEERYCETGTAMRTYVVLVDLGRGYCWNTVEDWRLNSSSRSQGQKILAAVQKTISRAVTPEVASQLDPPHWHFPRFNRVRISSMSSWRFSLSSRLSRRRTSEPVHPPPESSNDDNRDTPPRYSNVPLQVYEVLAQAPWQSVTSFVSQSSAPTYVTNDPDSCSIAASAITLSNPPRYSGFSDVGSPEIYGDLNEASGSGYAYPIRNGSQSKPWATLRLNDAEASTSRTSNKRRHPRISNAEKLVGSVVLNLPKPKTIKNIELLLKGHVITGSLADGGSMTFLDHTFTLWDRKFGDPQRIASGSDQSPQSADEKYDGKLGNNWVFPFCIPFPTQVDLSTRCAVYREESDGPIRFLPQRLGDSSTITPFDLEILESGVYPASHAAPLSAAGISPFDTRVPYTTSEKGQLRSHPGVTPAEIATSHFSPMQSAPVGLTVPDLPSVMPFTIEGWEANSSKPCDGKSGAPYSSSPLPVTPKHDQFQRPSFLEKDVGANVHYELILSITHGTFSTKSRVNATLVHMPTSVARPMTLERQAAYRKREIPPGPDLDPAGWRDLPRVSIKGTYLDQRDVTLHYDIFLVQPRVGGIRQSSDSASSVAAIDWISTEPGHAHSEPGNRSALSQIGTTSMLTYHGNPNQPKISNSLSELARRQESERPSGRHSEGRPSAATIDPFMSISEDEDIEFPLGRFAEYKENDVGRAAWCTPSTFTQEPNVRRLYGEIHLPRGLQPTCRFPLFSILYRVELLAPSTNAFVPDLRNSSRKGTGSHNDVGLTSDSSQNQDETVYASQLVEITTHMKRGEPVPIAFVKGTA
ncbi:hypothetical protein NMY22_g7592 [Coprinellus aureogranulatus]|nr:hypothetical protein NMY22_g7592 [Coprinellus aureogranulatus]